MLKECASFVLAVLAEAGSSYKTPRFWKWVGGETTASALGTVALAWQNGWAKEAWLDAASLGWRFLLLLVGATCLGILGSAPYRIWQAQRKSMDRLAQLLANEQLLGNERLSLHTQMCGFLFYNPPADPFLVFPSVIAFNPSKEHPISFNARLKSDVTEDHWNNIPPEVKPTPAWEKRARKLRGVYETSLLKLPTTLSPQEVKSGYLAFCLCEAEEVYFKNLVEGEAVPLASCLIEVEEPNGTPIAELSWGFQA